MIYGFLGLQAGFLLGLDGDNYQTPLRLLGLLVVALLLVLIAQHRTKVATAIDVDEVIEMIKAISEELQADVEIGPLILEPVEVFGLDQFGGSAIVIK